MDSEKKTWLLKTCVLTLIPLMLVAAVNYFMDPLWCFDVSHRYNQVQTEISERRQKTNHITFTEFDYRGLLIGASRSAFISQYSFKDLPTYNYSLNAMSITEMPHYIAYAKKRNGKPFAYLFLALDFEKAGETRQSIQAITKPEEYIRESTSLFHRAKVLLSFDTLTYSIRNFQNYRRGTSRWYDRSNVQHIKRFTREELEQIYYGHMILYTDEKTSWYRTFRYLDEYADILRKIRQENEESTIIPFVPPAAVPVMEMIVRCNLLDDYERWLSEIVDVFGGVYVFMYPHEITRDYYTHFFDPSHAYPEIGDVIADVIYNNRMKQDAAYGLYIDKSNLSEKTAYLQKSMRDLNDPLVRDFISSTGRKCE
jgi:hypothetical protein